MQSDLAAYRNMQPDDNMPSMSLLFTYSKYKKEREEAAAAAATGHQQSYMR